MIVRLLATLPILDSWTERSQSNGFRFIYDLNFIAVVFLLSMNCFLWPKRLPYFGVVDIIWINQNSWKLRFCFGCKWSSTLKMELHEEVKVVKIFTIDWRDRFNQIKWVNCEVKICQDSIKNKFTLNLCEISEKKKSVFCL